MPYRTLSKRRSRSWENSLKKRVRQPRRIQFHLRSGQKARFVSWRQMRAIALSAASAALTQTVLAAKHILPIAQGIIDWIDDPSMGGFVTASISTTPSMHEAQEHLMKLCAARVRDVRHIGE